MQFIEITYNLIYNNMENNKSTYIHETHHLYCSDGEMHIGYGKDKWLVYNTDQLFPLLTNFSHISFNIESSYILRSLRNFLAT